MAHRDHQYHLANPNMEDGDSTSDDENGYPLHQPDVDSDNEFDDDEDAFFDDHQTDSIRPSSDDGLDDDDVEDGDADDDALTWDTVSEASIRGAPTTDNRDDEWFPLNRRREAFPNFVLPTTTRSAIPIPQFNADHVPAHLVPTAITTSSHPSTSHASTANATVSNIIPSNPPFLYTTKTYHHHARQAPVRPASPESEDSDEGDSDYHHYVGVMRPEPTKSELLSTVLDYFLHHGHSEVVDTFCKEMGLKLPEKEIQAMNERNEVRDLIWSGEMEKAIERIPAELLEDEDVEFAVRKQHIIEMIRAEKTQEPVEYFRKHLMKDGKRPEDDKMDIIEKIFTLMVYADSNSQFQIYMGQGEREATAKIVNSALLGNAGKSRASHIDLLAKSIAWAQNEVALKQRPGAGSTTVAWAEHLFAEPFSMNEFVTTAIKICPLDQTEDLC